MKSLNQDLKEGRIKQLYLLYGEEGYLRKSYRNRLTQAIMQDGDKMNYHYYEGKGLQVGKIIDQAETLPFFSDRRLIVIENSGFFKNAAVELAEYLKDIPETTAFIFVEAEVDKRSKMFKVVKDKGSAVELGVQDEKMLLQWIGGMFKKEQKKIEEKTARYILEKVGNDMQHLQCEIEKLICYTVGRNVVTIADVDAICITQIGNHIFDMVNAVAEKRQKQALEYYYELLALKEPPMRILYLLTRQFRLLYQVKGFAGKGFSNKDIGSKLGLHPYAVGKHLSQGRQFQKQELWEIMQDAAETEEAVKTGRLTDKLGVELFIVKYSMA